MKYVRLVRDAEVKGTLRRMSDEPILHLIDEEADALIEAGHEDVTADFPKPKAEPKPKD